MKSVERKHNPQTWKSELRCATGRSAIRQLMAAAAPATVLMPSYVPEGVIDPVKHAEVPIVFYRLRADLSPDLCDLRQRLDTRARPALVVVIDYFGVEYVTAEIRSLCNAAGAFLFEDCAHAYWAEAEYADFALWSLNKIFPVPDGAVLRSRRYDVDVDWYLCQPDNKAIKLYRDHLQQNAAGDHDLADVTYEKYYERIRNVFVPCEQSQESELIEQDKDFILAEHEARFWNWYFYSWGVPRELRLCENPHAIPAFAYPILCPRYQRENIKERLEGIGVRAAICLDKWNHVPSDDGFGQERDFMVRHLLLPVGRDVMRADIERVVDCLKGYVEKVAA